MDEIREERLAKVRDGLREADALANVLADQLFKLRVLVGTLKGIVEWEVPDGRS